MSLNSRSSDADGAVQQGYWVRLTNQMDLLQAAVEEAAAAARASESQVQVLLRHLTDPDRSQVLDERLADLLAGQEAVREQGEALAGNLSELAQTVTRLNRTQFKSNALGEMRDQQVSTALGALQEVAGRREQAREDQSQLAQERAAGLRDEARGEFAADLLPVLDGLELALESGRTLLARQRVQEAELVRSAQRAALDPGPLQPGLGQRLAWAIKGGGPPPGSAGAGFAPLAAPQQDELALAVEAWLQGLELVRTRFLALLATADIYPIEAAGQPFDPHLHLAMATGTRTDTPDGTVVEVLRKGYRQRGRVLRYAEVTVNHTPVLEDHGQAFEVEK